MNAVAADRVRINGHFPQYSPILLAHCINRDGAVAPKCVRASIEHRFKIAHASHETRIVEDRGSNHCIWGAITENGKWDAAADESREDSGGGNVNEEFSGYIADFPRKTKGPHNRNADMVVAKDPENRVEQRRALG